MYILFVTIIYILSYVIPGETKETQKIRQNPEKWGCDSLRCISMAEFHLYWAKMQITLSF